MQEFCDHMDRETGSLQAKDDLTMVMIEVQKDGDEVTVTPTTVQ